MRRLLLSSVLVASTVLASSAFAQYDTRTGAGSVTGSTVITSPALGGGATNPTYGGGATNPGATVVRPSGTTAPMPAGMVSRLDDRVDQLEELVRQLTGKVEEANFKAQQAQKQLERLQADIDLRFKDLQSAQQNQQGAAAQTTQSAPPAQGQSQNQLSMPAAKGADQPGPASGPQSLGSMPEKDLKKALQQPAQAQAAAPKDAQGLYDQSYDSLQRGDYGAAEKGFQDFLAQYGNHALAGNAQYWLGDIAYVRKDFNTAAATFLEGYKKYSKHNKAADMIYKAGSSFGLMGKTKEACTAFAILFKEQPKMPDRVKRAATAEKTKYGCK